MEASCGCTRVRSLSAAALLVASDYEMSCRWVTEITPDE